MTDAALHAKLLRSQWTASLKEYAALGDEEALAVGRELARRVQLRPKKASNVPLLGLAEQALAGDEKAAHTLVRLRFE